MRTLYTEEPQAVVVCDLQPSQTLKIMAFAGTGKTSTLLAYAQARLRLRFLDDRPFSPEKLTTLKVTLGRALPLQRQKHFLSVGQGDSPLRFTDGDDHGEPVLFFGDHGRLGRTDPAAVPVMKDDAQKVFVFTDDHPPDGPLVNWIDMG
jgi:hypothetical protein